MRKDPRAPLDTLVFVVRSKTAQLPCYALEIFRDLAPHFDEVLVFVRQGQRSSVGKQIACSAPNIRATVRSFGRLDHHGATLLFASQVAKGRTLTLVDTSLVGVSGAETVKTLAALPGPVKTLIGFETVDRPLNLEGGVLVADSNWLRDQPELQTLKRRANRSWFDLGKTLTGWRGSTVTSAFPGGDPRRPWLADGLGAAIENRIPYVPWKAFTADPLDVDAVGLRPKRALDYLVDRGLDSRVFWRHLLSVAPSQTWHANLDLFTVTSPFIPKDGAPDGDPDGDPDGAVTPGKASRPLVTAVLMHVFYVDMFAEMLSYARNVPAPAKLYVTTDTVEKAAELERALHDSNHFEHAEVRVVGSNRGRDIPAFLIDGANVLLDETVDLVVKLHSKKSAQVPEVVGTYFKDHLFDNLVGTPHQAQLIRQMFAEEPQLGLVFPPMIRMGHPTSANGWATNRLPAQPVGRRLGFELSGAGFPARPHRYTALREVPADIRTPIAPYGSMFWARRKALLPLVEANFDYDEFPTNETYVDGSLAHVLERLTAYAAYSRGFYARTVQTAANAQVTGAMMDATLAAFSRVLPLSAREQDAAAQAMQPVSVTRSARDLYALLLQVSPGTAGILRTGLHAARRAKTPIFP